MTPSGVMMRSALFAAGLPACMSLNENPSSIFTGTISTGTLSPRRVALSKGSPTRVLG